LNPQGRSQDRPFFFAPPAVFPAGVWSNADQEITVLLTPEQPASYGQLKERDWLGDRRKQRSEGRF
jgi:hypothetical protein